MAIIVTVAQQKGGAGKTTLVAQLAVAWGVGARRVGLIDTDPQGSLTAWFMRREHTLESNTLMLRTCAGWKISSEMDRLKRDCDLIIVDSPPHKDNDARTVIRAAQMVVVPVQPSPMDLWATKPSLDLARNEKVPVLLVLNRLPPRGRLQDTMRAQVQETGFPLAECALGNRVAFAASLLEGKGVTETEPSSAAANEIRALAEEILAHVPKR